MTAVVDAHQHFWTTAAPWHGWPGPDLPAIHRDFGPDDLAPLLADEGVAGTVLVQSQPDDADTDWMLALAWDRPEILGVVGWVDMLAPSAPARIAALAAHPKCKGIRPMLQDLPADWILQPAARPALDAIAASGLVLDALITPIHLAAIEAVGRRHSGLTIVIDHAAKPDIALGFQQSWADDLARVAALPKAACKLSGLVTEAGAGWQPADLADHVRTILSLFGADRVLWGSDWPVLLLRATYDRWLRTARSLTPVADHAAVFGSNAVRLYHLSPRKI